jgi:hypothetical protein
MFEEIQDAIHNPDYKRNLHRTRTPYSSVKGERGGREWYHSNHFDLAYNRRCFLGTFKGLLSSFKSQKTGFSVQGQKRGHLF